MKTDAKHKKASPGEDTGWQASPTRGEDVRMRETLVESGEPKPAEVTPEGIRGKPQQIAAFLPTWRDPLTGECLTVEELRKALCDVI